MAKEDIIQHYRSPTAGRIPIAGELTYGEWHINYADGIAYLKDSGGNIRKFRSLEEKTFNVVTPGQTSFPVLATATKVLVFLLNQLDYSEFVTISPPGSGNIIFNAVSAEYTTEVGDYVKVLYF